MTSGKQISTETDQLWRLLIELLEYAMNSYNLRCLLSKKQGWEALNKFVTILTELAPLYKNQPQVQNTLIKLTTQLLKQNFQALRTSSVSLLGIVFDLMSPGQEKERVYELLKNVLLEPKRYGRQAQKAACESLNFSYASLTQLQREEIINLMKSRSALEHFHDSQEVQDLLVLHDRCCDMKKIAKRTRKWWRSEYGT